MHTHTYIYLCTCANTPPAGTHNETHSMRALALSLSLFCSLTTGALWRWLPPTAEIQIQNGDASLSRCSYAAAAAAALLLLRICRIFIHNT